MSVVVVIQIFFCFSKQCRKTWAEYILVFSTMISKWGWVVLSWALHIHKCKKKFGWKSCFMVYTKNFSIENSLWFPPLLRLLTLHNFLIFFFHYRRSTRSGYAFAHTEGFGRLITSGRMMRQQNQVFQVNKQTNTDIQFDGKF